MPARDETGEKSRLANRCAALFILLPYLLSLSALSAQEAIKPAIKVGATLALSGKLAYMGQREYEGLQLAVEELNKAGGVNGRPLAVLVEDNLGDAKTAVAGIAKLLTVDKVDLVVSAFTHITQSIKEVVAKSGKVMIYESGMRAIAENNPRFFRDYYDSQAAGQAMAEGVKRRGHRRVAFLGELSDSCQEYAAGFKEKAAAAGIEIVREESYSAGETDFRPLLLKLKASRPEGLVLATWRDTALVMKQIKEVGMISIPTYHFVGQNSPEADTPEMRSLFEENRALSSWYGFVEGSATPEQRAFIDKYKARFQQEPRADSAFMYDDAYVLAAALKSCVTPETVNQACVAARLLETDYDGIAGNLKFNSHRVSSRKVFLVRVERGRWVEF